jgi:tetratricopeptide (TPR) repeat protein
MMDEGDWSGALELLESALRRAPDHDDAPEWHSDCGVCLVELGRYSEAVEAFTETIELVSGDAYAYRRRGNCHFALQHYEQALADYNSSIRLDPDESRTYADRSEVWEQWEQWSEAIENLNKAVSLSPHASRIARWRQRLVALQASAAAEPDAVQSAEKKRSHAAAAGSAASEASGDPPSKRLKATDVKDVKGQGEYDPCFFNPCFLTHTVAWVVMCLAASSSSSSCSSSSSSSAAAASAASACAAAAVASAPRKSMAEWSAAEVSDWLRSIAPAYAQYCAAFVDSGIDGRALLEFGHEELKEMGVALAAHRVRLMVDIKQHRSAAGAAPPSDSAAASTPKGGLQLLFIPFCRRSLLPAVWLTTMDLRQVMGRRTHWRCSQSSTRRSSG